MLGDPSKRWKNASYQLQYLQQSNMKNPPKTGFFVSLPLGIRCRAVPGET